MIPASALPALALLLFAPFAGSFLALVADRLPRGQGIVAPRSACRACAVPLGARDLVPFWSYLRRGGHCRHCGAPIPAWLLYMEIAATGLALCAVLRGGGAVEIWLAAGLLWVLMTLTATDLTRLRLPDALTGALLLAALALALRPGGHGAAQALIGAGAGAGSFAALRWGYRALRGREGLGLGDVKLMAGLGALTGPALLPLVVLAAALATIAAALAGGRARRPLPFGAALCVAGGLVWLGLGPLPAPLP